MPVSLPKERPHPGKPFRTLSDAAEQDQIVAVHCNRCRRTLYFLATDLIQVVNPALPLHISPFTCSVCGTAEYMSTKAIWRDSNKHGSFYIRRLVEIRQQPIWKSVPFGEKH